MMFFAEKTVMFGMLIIFAAHKTSSSPLLMPDLKASRKFLFMASMVKILLLM